MAYIKLEDAVRMFVPCAEYTGKDVIEKLKEIEEEKWPEERNTEEGGKL